MITSFRNQYFFLSNFCNSPVIFEGLLYLNNEAAFQSAKLKDIESRTKLKAFGKTFDFTNMQAYEAKSLGRRIELRVDWEEIKDSVMYSIIYDKFTRSKFMNQMLLSTSNEELIEVNTWNDTYWGVCNGVGENKLGKILMRVRGELFLSH